VKIRIFAVGRPALPFARVAVADYLARLEKLRPVQLEFLRAGDPPGVARRLLARSAGCHRIVVDERGSHLTTREFAAWLARLESSGGVRSAAFLVGAADGHDAALRQGADFVLALSKMTLQHELALVVLLEQLYRAADLLRGGPYHRD
jgi:23S rRNA (pseudouridine1915-N3)-methyltransferase